MSSSEDEDIKLAIALSMRESQDDEVIDLDSDNDEVRPMDPKTANDHSTSKALGVLGLDRKKMEQERLARKRKVSMSPPPARKSQKTEDNDSSKLREQSLQTDWSSRLQSPANPAGFSNSIGLDQALYNQGTVKRTWAFGHLRASDDIKLEEVLQKNDLSLAVLSSFQWDVAWLLSKINTSNTQVTFVMQAKDEGTKQQYRRETADMRNLRLCFPPMEGQVNCMHSKLMLLSHPSYLRVAVPTANLVPYDWGESGDMENMVFIIDLPRLSDKQPKTSETPFERDLIYFLNAMGLEQSIVNSISNFDFAATKDFAFVHTIGGAHTGGSWRRTGYCGLGRAVKELGLSTDSALNVDFVTSSVGSLNLDFLAMLYLAAQGDDGTTEYGWRNPETGKGKSRTSKLELAEAEAAQEEIRNEIRHNFHIYFPTHETVKSSTAGFAGTICFQSKWYNSSTFPRQLLRDCKSTRRGLLMHNKILYVRPTGAGVPWAYVGSANCSESAWGKLVKDRATKAPKLNCRNWECGVIIPIRQGETRDASDETSSFNGIVPVPMHFPGEAYGNRRPWYYSEQ